MNCLIIARITFLEAFRQRFFPLLAILALALVASSLFFQQFNFGSSELKFIVDLGFGSILFFGSLLAIVLSSQTLFAEYENRTLFTVLARPVSRSSFLVGKSLGILALLFCFVLVLVLVTGSLLWVRHQALLQEFPQLFPEYAVLRYTDLPVLGLVYLLKLCILTGMTFLVGAFAKSNLYTVVVSFLLLLIAQLQHLAEESYAREGAGWLWKMFAGLIAVLFPNFQFFNVGDQLVYAESGEFSPFPLGAILGYGVLYLLAYGLIACGLFQKREF